MRKELLGEFSATFILILFGCGSVGAAVISNILSELYQVAFFWGLGVTLGIFATRRWSPAHMNPAVSLAMVIYGSLPLRKLGWYSLAQFLGAFAAAGIIYLVFQNELLEFESSQQIVRGSSASMRSAMMFGEFYPNPANKVYFTVTQQIAFLIEFAGTFILLSMIFLIIHTEKPKSNLSPVLIGLLVSTLIIFVAPFTQACFNPARDLGPRLIAMFAGWGRAAFPPILWSTFTVYILAPLTGAGSAGLLFKFISLKKESYASN